MDIKPEDGFEIKQEELIIPEPEYALEQFTVTAESHVLDKNYICDYCSYRTNVKDTLKNHLKRHIGKKPFECDMCNFKTNYKHSLGRHKLKCKRIDHHQYFCEHCPYITNSEESLITHIDFHLKSTIIACELCDYKTVLESHFHQHLKKHNSDERDELHCCKKCKYKTANKCHFKQHMLVHTGGILHSCKRCNYTTTNKYNLQKHSLGHVGKGPDLCQHCDYKAQSKNDLKQHLLQHTAKKLHSCELCNYTTINKHHLKRHFSLHTGEKAHHCNMCDYKTVSKWHLMRHIQFHTGEKPHHCNQCDFKTVSKWYLKKHHLKVHIHNKKHSGQSNILQCADCSYHTRIKSKLRNHVMYHIDERKNQLKNSCDEDTKDSEKFLLDPDVVPEEYIVLNSMDFTIKEEPNDLYLIC